MNENDQQHTALSVKITRDLPAISPVHAKLLTLNGTHSHSRVEQVRVNTILYFSDFLYYRESPGDPCIMVEGISESWFIPTDCQPGGTYNKSLGYVKIEGDMCAGGEEAIFSDKETKCPDQS